MRKEIVELKAVRSEWYQLSPRIDGCIGQLSYFYKYDPTQGFKELESLVTDFNTMVNRTTIVLEPFGIHDTLLPKPIEYYSRLGEEDMHALLRRMKIIYSGVDSILDSLIEQPMLPPEKEKDLEVLKTEIGKKLEPDLPLFASDLKHSIESFRKADYLGSTLIAGRTMDVIFHKIESTLPKGKDGKVELTQIIDFLKDKGVLEKGEHEGSSAILGAIKIYRNKFSHRVGVYPGVEECLIVISGSSHLLNKIVEKNLHSELGL